MIKVQHNMQTRAPFKCFKKFGSAKVAARIWIEDKGHTTQAQKNMKTHAPFQVFQEV